MVSLPQTLTNANPTIASKENAPTLKAASRVNVMTDMKRMISTCVLVSRSRNCFGVYSTSTNTCLWCPSPDMLPGVGLVAGHPPPLPPPPPAALSISSVRFSRLSAGSLHCESWKHCKRLQLSDPVQSPSPNVLILHYFRLLLSMPTWAVLALFPSWTPV